MISFDQQGVCLLYQKKIHYSLRNSTILDNDVDQACSEFDDIQEGVSKGYSTNLPIIMPSCDLLFFRYSARGFSEITTLSCELEACRICSRLL